MADLRGARGTRAPPGGPNSFNFMQFLGKFGKIVCWRPPGGVGEILDPPLLGVQINYMYIIEQNLWTRLVIKYDEYILVLTSHKLDGKK